MNNIEITDKVVGGNIILKSFDGKTAKVEVDLRDSADWFYWQFCVKNAGGKTIEFDFGKKEWIGYFGPAISRNQRDWHWQNTDAEMCAKSKFTYTFADGENEVYFAHNMYYHPDRFLDFANKNGLEIKDLCTSKKGRSIPYVTFGDGDKKIVLTARHHSCESTGNYVLEGVIESLLKQPVDGYEVLCIPFVDYDGVVDGDQGKNRYPHDHNRDYDLNKEPIYETTSFLREYAEQNEVVFCFDFHSPWHLWGQNDLEYIVQNNLEKVGRLNRFGKIFEQCISDDAFRYEHKNDYPPNFEWNRESNACGTKYMNQFDCCELSFSLETPYFGEKDNIFMPEKAIELGKCFVTAVHKYIDEKMNSAKISFSGDVLCYPAMTEKAQTPDGLNYNPVFENAKSAFECSDYNVINLETPIAGEDMQYTNEQFCFNSPDEFLNAVSVMGGNIMCLANNHCMDRGEEGLLKTIEACEKAGLDTVGVYKTEQDGNKIVVKNLRGVKIAFLNYTYGTNAFAHHRFLKDDHKFMVNLLQPEETLPGSIHLLESAETIEKLTKELYFTENDTYNTILAPYIKKLETDIKRAKEMADIVVFCLHCGGQYNEQPEAYTKFIASKIKEYGADIIVGLHPHIIQPCTVEDDFVTAYCLGNLIFSPPDCEYTQTRVDKAYSAVLHIYPDVDRKCIKKVTFSLMKTFEEQPGYAKTFDTFGLYNKTKDKNLLKDIEYYANYFAGKKCFDGIKPEYTLWEK